jgi:hypothetical protein
MDPACRVAQPARTFLETAAIQKNLAILCALMRNQSPTTINTSNSRLVDMLAVELAVLSWFRGCDRREKAQKGIGTWG